VLYAASKNPPVMAGIPEFLAARLVARWPAPWFTLLPLL
jgi:hypothetical protein